MISRKDLRVAETEWRSAPRVAPLPIVKYPRKRTPWWHFWRWL